MKKLIAKLTCQKGQGTLEYILMVGVVLAILAALGVMSTAAGNPIRDAINNALTLIKNNMP